jgi:signal transduction histidine kinase
MQQHRRKLLQQQLLLWIAFLCFNLSAAAQGSAIHITTAQFAQSSEGSFDLPPERLALPSGLKWQTVNLPYVSHANQAQNVPPAVTTAWYRIELTPLHREQWESIGSHQIHLYLLRWRGVAQIAVYGDDQLLFNSRGSAVWNGFNHPLWLPIAPTQHAKIPSSITIRLSHGPQGGAVSSLWIGPAEEMMWRWRMRSWLQVDVPYIASYTLLALGFFAGCVWLVRRREPMYVYFALAAALYWIRCLHYHWGEHPIPLSDEWFGWLTVMSAGWLVIVGHHMAFHLHRGIIARWIEHSAMAMIVAASVLMLPPVQSRFQSHGLGEIAIPLAYLLIIISGVGIVSATLLAAWRSNSREAKWLSMSSAGQVLFGIYDLALLNWVFSIEMLFLLPYGIIGLFLIYLGLAWRRYIQALGESEQAHLATAARLQAREEELAASYEKLRVIERERILHDERQRLMQDMHDGLGSSLVSALRLVEHGHMGEADLAQVLKECIDDLKLTIDSLEPVDTDVLLLLAAFRYRLAPRLEKTGIRLQWNAIPLPPLIWLTPRHALHILRITQEVFSNIIKYAQAQQITLSTEHDTQSVRIHILDNGVQPLDVQAQHTGRGLTNIRRRAQAIGAQVQWRGQELGMRFTLSLPLQQPSDTAFAYAQIS